jgi:hypothetical protein
MEADLWSAAQTRAKAESTTLTKVIKDRLALYSRALPAAAPTAVPRDLLTQIIATGPQPPAGSDYRLATEAAADLLRAFGIHTDHTAEEITGTGTQRNFRVDDELWKPAEERAGAEGTTMSQFMRDRLALYGSQVSDGAEARDPWEIINLVAREYGVGPDTDLALAQEAAAELLRALGIRPARGGQEVRP